MTDSDNVRRRYARQFGLPVAQVKFFNELTDAQLDEVEQIYGLYNVSSYVYAVKQDGGLVWRRLKR